jgi:uncharacterized iron-regulated protein
MIKNQLVDINMTNQEGQEMLLIEHFATNSQKHLDISITNQVGQEIVLIGHFARNSQKISSF